MIFFSLELPHSNYSVDVSSPPIDIPVITRHRLIKSLDSWNFEPHKLPDEEVFCCTLILFETLFRVEQMQDDVGVSLSE